MWLQFVTTTTNKPTGFKNKINKNNKVNYKNNNETKQH